MIWFFIGGEVGKKQLMTDYHLSEKEARQCALSRFYGFMTFISTVYAITQIKDAGSLLAAVIIGGICGLLYWNADRIKKKGIVRFEHNKKIREEQDDFISDFIFWDSVGIPYGRSSNNVLENIQNDKNSNSPPGVNNVVEQIPVIPNEPHSNSSDNVIWKILGSVIVLLLLLYYLALSAPSVTYQKNPFQTQSPALQAAVVLTPTHTAIPTSTVTVRPVIAIVCFKNEQNVRAGPGTEFEIVDVKQKDFCSNAYEYNQNKTWIKIEYDQITGWVYVPYTHVQVDWPFDH